MSPRMKYRPFDECKQLKNMYMYVCVSYRQVYHSQGENKTERDEKRKRIVRVDDDEDLSIR